MVELVENRRPSARIGVTSEEVARLSGARGRRIDLETVQERLRAGAVGAYKLLCSTMYYKIWARRRAFLRPCRFLYRFLRNDSIAAEEQLRTG